MERIEFPTTWSRRALALAAVTAVGAPLPAQAQDNTPLCEAIRRSTVGQWAEYRSSGGQPGVDRVRISVVAEEKQNGTTLQWIEMQMGTGADRMIAQVLVPGVGFGPEEIHGMVMKVGDQPAMKLPENMLGMMRGMAAQEGALDFAKECASAQVLGRGSVAVPAGTFPATHLKSSRGEAWVSPQVNFGLVKGRSDDGTEMVLAAQGTGAASAIQETPQEMPASGMRGP